MEQIIFALIFRFLSPILIVVIKSALRPNISHLTNLIRAYMAPGEVISCNKMLPYLYGFWIENRGAHKTEFGLTMLNPLTHGANTKEGIVVTPRNDPIPDNRGLLSNTLPQKNNGYHIHREPLLNTLPQTRL